MSNFKATIITHRQGSDAWHQHRARSLNASELASAMGISSYLSRSDLIKQKATGLVPEIDAHTQSRFDKGHEFEAIARPWAQEIIGSELYPVVLAVETDGLKLSASLDGLTMMNDISFEHKTGNADLLESLERGFIPEEYHPQMEMGLMLSGAEKCLFMASSGDKDSMRWAWYTPNFELRAQIVPVWAQLQKDILAYTPTAAEVKAVAAPQFGLPAVSIQVSGSIALIDNLQAFGTALTAYVEKINLKPETDQDFADLEATVKTLKNAENALDAAESGALAQTESIDAMRRTVAMYRETARTNRLLIDKLVKVEKENRKAAIVRDVSIALATHLEALNTRIGKPYMPAVPADFGGAVKGLKSIDSMRDAVNTTLAKAKIEANAIADKIHVNLRAISEQREHQFLFSDVASLVLKDPEFVEMAIKNRVAEHHAIEAARIETERQRIATEERAKAEADIAEAKRASEEAIAKAAQQAPIAVQPRQPMQPVQIVEQAQVTQPEDTGATMRLGQICEKLGFTVTAEFLFSLGFEPSATEKNAKLYKARLFPLICRALVKHINNVSELLAA